jgi:hypothetical protein
MPILIGEPPLVAAAEPAAELAAAAALVAVELVELEPHAVATKPATARDATSAPVLVRRLCRPKP